MKNKVCFSPEAEAQLADLFSYIARASSWKLADGYVSAVIDYCEGLSLFPLRGRSRDDIRPGLRVTTYRRRTVIAYVVHEGTVMILGIFHGGRDYESFLNRDDGLSLSH